MPIFIPRYANGKKIGRQIITCKLSIRTEPTYRDDKFSLYVFYNNSSLVVDVFRYFFPTYENDALLCSLEDDEDEDEKEEENNANESNTINTDRS